MTNSQHLYEVRPRKDKRGFDLISDALPFSRLWKRARIGSDCRTANAPAMMSLTISAQSGCMNDRRVIKVRRVSGNTLKAIALLLLLSCGALFGTDALENGTLPVVPILALAAATLIFWIGEKLNPF